VRFHASPGKQALRRLSPASTEFRPKGDGFLTIRPRAAHRLGPPSRTDVQDLSYACKTNRGATYGTWADDLKGTIAPTSEFVNRTTGFVFGLQVETAW
jgi:hypothetical protein